MCAAEEAVRSALNIKTPRMFLIKQQGVAYCDKCKIPSNNTVSNTAIIKVKCCENLTCF